MTKGSFDSWRNRFQGDWLDPDSSYGSPPNSDGNPLPGSSSTSTSWQNLLGGDSGPPAPPSPPTPAGPTSANDSGVWVGDLGSIDQAPSPVDSGSGGGSGGSTPSQPSGSGSSFVINVIYDQSVSSLPAGFTAAIQDAVTYLESIITTPITVNIDVGYGEIDGQALQSGALGESETYLNEYSYSSIKTALANVDPSAAATLPSNAPGDMWLSDAQAEALGLAGTTDSGTVDAYAGFSSVYPFTYNPSNRAVAGEYDFIGVVEHEFTEDMGRIDLFGESLGDGYSGYSVLDLFHYTSQGVHTYTGTTTDYFSVNGGKTALDYFNSNPDGDLGDWASSAGDDSFLAFSPTDEADVVSQTDITEMNAIGFQIAGQNGIVVASNGTDALQGGPAAAITSGAPVITDSGQTNLTSATIQITNSSGSPVAGDELFVNGQQSGTLDGGLVSVSWNSSTDTLTLTGSVPIAEYETLLGELTYQDTGTDSSSGNHPVRDVTWTVNDGTNTYTTTSNVTIDRAPVVNSATAKDAVGTTLSVAASSGVLSTDTDLDGDTLTVSAVSDTAHGAGTVGQALAGVYGQLTLNANGAYTYTANNASALASAPTGVHPQDVFNYTVSDGNGGTSAATLTVTLDRAPVVTASNVSLSVGHATVAASTLFTAADPDGDAITYEFNDTGSNGHFDLNGVAQANNQLITVTAAQLSELTYQSAPGGLSDTLQVTVSDGTLSSSTVSFTVAPPPLVIQTDTSSYGSTTLTEVANDYYLYNSSGSGPELTYNGAPVVAGQFGSGWVPIGAVQTASGYDLAWEIPGANTFNIWTVSSSGNYVSNIGAVAGNNATLESYEPIFGQDLNGDGTIGLQKTVIRTDTNGSGVSTTLAAVGNDYYLLNSSGTGPELQFGGAPVVAGQFGSGWVPFGAVQTASGYDLAWEIPGSNTYNIWTIDSGGNYISNIGAVAGNNATLESYEPIFGQDLNGDGVIGLQKTVIQTDTNGSGVSTTLAAVGSDYYLLNSSGTGPELQFGGAPVVAGQFGSGWVPFGAVQTASGYDLAWEIPGANTFNIWTIDSSGNYISNIGAVAGNNATLESYEPIFGQDLNSDGTIGLQKTVIQTDKSAYGSTTLAAVGDDYYLFNSSGTGPELQFGGSPVVAGQFGSGWEPVGAVKTASGYDLAWEIPGANSFNIWTLDSNGNYLSNIGAVPGNSYTLESYEPIFDQDLNGDGTIGPTKTASQIQTDTSAYGTTTLTEVGNDYYLYNSSGSGPELQYNGSPVVAGQFGSGWVPIGAVQTATGYDLAWEIPGANTFNIWTVSSSGNYISNIGAVAGNTSTLESYEPIFNQDLNGDGVIGPPATAGTTLAGQTLHPTV